MQHEGHIKRCLITIGIEILLVLLSVFLVYFEFWNACLYYTVRCYPQYWQTVVGPTEI